MHNAQFKFLMYKKLKNSLNPLILKHAKLAKIEFLIFIS